MNLLSREMENALIKKMLNMVSKYLETREKAPTNSTNLITPKKLEEELDIGYNTLQRWERAGLKRYQPPIEDSRKVFYLISDILIFLGVENGR